MAARKLVAGLPQRMGPCGVPFSDLVPQPPGYTGFIFYLTVPEPLWLERAGVPLFVSATRIRERLKRRTLPRALAPWCVDSGGFFHLRRHGRWMIDARQYAREVRRWREEIGNLVWAAPQDWMCELDALQATGLSVPRHVENTVDNFLELMNADPELPWLPVLQGARDSDYRAAVELYRKRGIALEHWPTVGVGSVCRLQSDVWGDVIVRMLYDFECLHNLHGFGVKTTGLLNYRQLLQSSDSMAWSTRARYDTQAGPGARNSLEYALRWREKLLRKLGEPV